MSTDHILETGQIVLPHATTVALIARAQGLTPAQRADLKTWPPHKLDEALTAIDTTAIVRDALDQYLGIGINPFAGTSFDSEHP